ncbi:MAG: peptide deformylase [Candidatus Omnitrophica bacterium]|nr:peptide deformylase [Candidatus Omnitrophota bacterium]
MNHLIIKKFPNSCLRKKAEKVKKISYAEKELLSEMAKIMYLNEGVGLAATQVGINFQLVVIDIGQGLIKLINPEIISREGKQTSEEGCLSVPGTVVKVKRAEKVNLNFLDENGNASRLRTEGLLARVVQHEMDHLSGKLIIDYLNPIKKLLIKRKKS